MHKLVFILLISTVAFTGCSNQPSTENNAQTIPETKAPKDMNSEQAVIVSFMYEHDNLDPLYELEDQLTKVISENHLGEYDGHEIAMDGSKGTLYMYGPNADSIYNAIMPILRDIPFMRGASVVARYGAPGSEFMEGILE
jgi:hypothetical protein